MKTMTKKMGAIVLALAMCFSLCCTALAADGDDETKGSITISGAVAGEEYSIYQMFYLTYATGENDEGQEVITSYSYVVPDEWHDFLTHYPDDFKLTTIDNITYIDPSSPVFQEGAGGLDMAEFAQDALAYANKTDQYDGREGEVIEPVATISFTYDAETETATGVGCTVSNVVIDSETGVVTASLYIGGLDLGYYLVDTTLGSLCSLDTTAPDAEILEKNETPGVEKTVDWDSTESTENHRSVEYELDIDHIKGVSSLVLHDKMEVDIDDVYYEFDYDHMTVTLKDGGTEIKMEEGVDYVLITKEDVYEDGDQQGEPIITDGCDFHVVFTVGGVDYDFSNCSEDAIIEVIVGCELDALNGAVFGDNDLLDIPNQACVTYGGAGRSVWKEADVYEYGFRILKYTGEGEAMITLAGAHFMLTNNNPGTEEEPNEDYGKTAYFSQSGSTYVLQGWGDEIPEGYTNDLVSDEEGNISIEGLGEGTYTIKETAAPDGYNMLDYTIDVTITPGTDNSSFSISYTYNKENPETVNPDDDTVLVENNAGTVLPSTGGIGTTIFYIIGGVLVAGAVVVLITRRRMSREA